MKKILSILFLALVITSAGYGQRKKSKEIAGYTFSNYEIECMGTGTEGSQLLMIYGYGKTPESAIIQAKMNAVHGVIFKGVTAGKGCMTKPLAQPGTEQENMDYFKAFFSGGGAYLNYVALSGEGVENSVRIDKKTYKVGIIVSVMHASLRKQLEKDGIIKGLSHGF